VDNSKKKKNDGLFFNQINHIIVVLLACTIGVGKKNTSLQ
jgi:hypothetical protein